MVWGIITPRGVGKLVRIDALGRMDRWKYVKVIEAGLLPTYTHYGYRIEDVHFIQDNNPKHTTGFLKDWMKIKGIRVVNWPPQSPDINILENGWAELVKRINRRDPQPRTLDELWEMLGEEWTSNSFNNYVLRSLYPSFPDRIQALLDSNGKHTMY